MLNSEVLTKMTISFVAAALSVGCASTGDTQEQPLAIVHAVQVGDDTLDCPDLQSQIFNAEQIVSKLTQEIEKNKATERSAETTQAVNSYLGGASSAASNLFSSLTGNAARQSIEDKREIRDSYQNRRDILLQQYMAMKCSVRAEAHSASSS